MADLFEGGINMPFRIRDLSGSPAVGREFSPALRRAKFWISRIRAWSLRLSIGITDSIVSGTLRWLHEAALKCVNNMKSNHMRYLTLS